MELEIWDEFAADPSRCNQVAQAILAADSTMLSLPDAAEAELMGVAEAVEGRALTGTHVLRERDPNIVRQKKAEVLAHAGELRCEVCGFAFGEHYGARGAGFIECHHTKPVSEYREGEKTRLADLALICSNCHRMIHARRPWLSMDDLRAIYRVDRAPHTSISDGN